MNKLFIIFISFYLISCSKLATDSTTDKVQIRIENTTGLTLEDAQVSDINYGIVSNHQTTEYKIANQPLYSGYCIFNVSGTPNFAGLGVCGTPLPPPFGPGYYTFKILPGINGYNEISITKK